MIRQLRIQRFRSILDVTIELGRVNLFIGANGTGKSNILEALGVLSAVAGRGLDSASLADRGVRLSVGPMFKSAFKNRHLPNSASITATFEGAPKAVYGMSFSAGAANETLKIGTEHLEVGDRRVLGRGPAGAKIGATVPLTTPYRSLWDSHAASLNVDTETRRRMAQLADYAIFAPETAVMRGAAVEQQPRLPLGLAGSGLAAAFGNLLQQRQQDQGKRAFEAVHKIVFMSGWANQIQVGKRDDNIIPKGLLGGADHLYVQDRFMHATRNKLSTFDASEGTLYLLFVATLLAHPETPRLLALDNADMALSPALAQRLIRHIATQVCAADRADPLAEQVLLTSHNPTALDGLDIFDPEQRLFVVYRDPKAGDTKVRRVEPPPGVTREEWVVEKHGRRLSTLLIEGLIQDALGKL